MSDWWYIAIAYTVVWGGLAVYALVLARRVNQAREVARALRDAAHSMPEAVGGDEVLCDAPPAP